MTPRLAMSALALGAFCAPAFAGPPTAEDQVAASFARMLNHAPEVRAPALPPTAQPDPLRQAISAVLWQEQPISFHVAMTLAAARK